MNRQCRRHSPDPTQRERAATQLTSRDGDSAIRRTVPGLGLSASPHALAATDAIHAHALFLMVMQLSPWRTRLLRPPTRIGSLCLPICNHGGGERRINRLHRLERGRRPAFRTRLEGEFGARANLLPRRTRGCRRPAADCRISWRRAHWAGEAHYGGQLSLR